MEENLLVEKSRRFALEIVSAYKFLQAAKEHVLSKQLLRSGTSIGANIAEGQYAQSRADFLSKYTIALKEASETRYWIGLLIDSDYLYDYENKDFLISSCDELLRLLISSTKKLKNT